MDFRILQILFLSLMLLPKLEAQLSPGDLAKAHADLEGMRNCTQCHTLGNKVENQKCLNCHKEIQELMTASRGLHNSRDVRGKDCASCHSDHHGRNFDMARFNENDFDHDLTGYDLTGAHTKIDCRDCHRPDFIDDREIKKRKDTFLGLEHDCISCHDDHHQNTLSSNDCKKCHSTEAFAPADYFDHEKTKYPLAGAHKNVQCIECHQKETRNGKEFQRFAGVEFSNCISCHDDVHNSNLGTNCKQCHSEESFASLRQIKRFNHNTTNFPLNGAHKRIDCKECHNMKASPVTIFQDRIGIKTNQCIECHEDIHGNKFGTNCAECHNEESFFSVDTDRFNHGLTDFPLVGMHRQVDCKECHTQSLTEPLAHNACAVCHDDYHRGEFAENGISPDCKECHTEQGFAGSLFTLEQHQESNFPLTGAHIATPCFECHIDEREDRWAFRDIGQRCVDCHDDVHQGYIAAEFYPGQDCRACHVTDNWTDNYFDHTITAFELLGKHAEATCMDCHAVQDSEANATNRYAGFADLSNQCADCHENVHEDQFMVNGVTDCARCHGFNDWTMDSFNHDKTAFPLEGAHASVECGACHKPIESDGKTIVQYKFKSFECIDCHQ